MILEDTAAFQVLFIVSIPGYFVLGTSLLWISTVAFTYLKVKSAKCLCLLPVVLVLVLLYRSWSCSCYFGLGLKNLVLFTSLPDSLAGEAWCPVRRPQEPTPLSAFGLDFRPFGPHSAASPNSLHFPQSIRVLIKTLVMPIFGAKECIKMQDFVLKIYKKNSGGRDPRTPAAEGETFVRTHPVPTCQMLVPLRFF